MKKLLAAALLLLLSITSNVFAQGLTAEENEWVKALTPFYKEAKAAGINATIAVVTDQESGATPAFMAFKPAKQECMFVVAVRNNRTAGVLMDMAKTGRGREVAKLAIFAHEYSHCLQNLADPSLSNNATDGKLVSRATAKEEAMGDVFALAWIAKNMPEDFDVAFRFLRDLRKVPQQGTDRYDILDYVYKARELPELMAKNPASPFAFAQSLVLGTPLPSAPAGAVASLTATVANAQ